MRTFRFALTRRSAAIVVLVVVLAVFWPGLSGGLIFDDSHAIAHNPSIHLEELTLDSIRSAWQGFGYAPSGRPLAMLTFGLNHLITGDNLFAFKLTSLIFHAINALLIFVLACSLLRFQSRDNFTEPAVPILLPLTLALIWAIHPLQVSTVLYVVQRMEILAVLFILLGLLAYIRGRTEQLQGTGTGWGWLIVAAAMLVPAYLSKETGLLLPLFIVCLELTVLRFRAASSHQQSILRAAFAVAIVGAIAIYLIVIWPRYSEPLVYATRDFNMTERLLTQLRVLPMYLGQIVWPNPQNYLFFYDNYPKSTGWLEPVTTLFGGIFLLLLLITAFAARNRSPLLSLGITWFFASHFLTSNIVPLELVFEHRNYFAVFAVVLAVAAMAMPLAKHLPMKSLVSALVVGLALITLITSVTWGHHLNLAMDLRNKNPESERAGYRLGRLYLQLSEHNPNSPFYGMARASFERLVQLEGASPMPEQALIMMDARAGVADNSLLWDGLIAKVEAGPSGPQQITAVRRLLLAHNSGVSIDPDRLLEAGIVLLNKPRIHPALYVEFALHALESSGDERVAEILLYNSALIAQSPDWTRKILNLLANRGHSEFAEQLEDQLILPTLGAP